MADCSIKECESGGNIVYCPNRFTFDEMCSIKMALHLAPNYIKDFMESVKDNYNSLEQNPKLLYDNGEKLANKMEELEKKVNDLINNAIG